MVVGIIGSRSIRTPIPEGVIPTDTHRIISGGAIGIDRCARQYAQSHHIIIEEILPAYDLYGKRAPLVRNDIIIDKSDMLFIFWDGKSRGSAYVINECRRKGKPFRVFTYENNKFNELSL